MAFALLTFFAAFSIEAIGTIVSVIGLSTLFGANPIIMTLAVALDVGKLVVVALLYKYWGELNRVMRAYGLIAAVITMTITSAGAAGYLSAEFQKAIIGTQEGQLKVQVLKDEQSKLEQRKKQIDDQIAAIPERFSANQKIRLMNQFKAEQQTVTDRLAAISQELPQIQIAQISTEAKAGPILSISKAFGITVEEAVKWVILLIIFVFDPLAVFLIVSGNFLLDRTSKKEEEKTLPVADDEQNGNVDVVPYSVAVLEKIAQKQAEDSDDGPVARTFMEEPEDYIRPPVEADEEPIDDTPASAIDELAETAKPETVEALAQDVADAQDAAQVENAPDQEEQSEPAIITKSSLGLVKPDPNTTINPEWEIGYKTGVYRSGVQS